MSNQRKRIWIDPFQTRLVVRLMFYTVVYQVSVWIILFTLRMVWGSMDAVTDAPPLSLLGWPALISVLSLVGLLTVDAVRYVHRLVGPIYRFRKTIQTIAAGEPVNMVCLRKDDFLKDLMVDFNRMLEVLEQKGAVTLQNNEAAATETVAAG